MTNCNFVVTDEENRYAARIGKELPLLGINRANERLCQAAAHLAGVAPGVAFFDDDILLTPFIDGKTLSLYDFENPVVVYRAAHLLRTLHAAPSQMWNEILPFCPFQTLDNYAATIHSLGGVLPESIANFLGVLPAFRRALSPFHPSLCHNDLLPENILDDGKQLWLVDWEYAGVGNPLFDLACISANSQLSPDMDRLLLSEYYSRPSDPILADLQRLKVVSHAREVLWALIQGATSQIDFDYLGYGDSQRSAFEEALERLAFYKSK